MTPRPSRPSSHPHVVPATTRDAVLARLGEVAGDRRFFAVVRDYQNRDVHEPIASAGEVLGFLGVVEAMVADAWRELVKPANGRQKWPHLLLFGSFLEAFSLTKSQNDFEACLRGAIGEFAQGREGGLPVAANLTFSLGWLRIDREAFAKVEVQVQTAFRIARKDRPSPGPAPREDLGQKPETPEVAPERRRRGRPPAMEVKAETRAAVRATLSPLGELTAVVFPQVARQVEHAYRPFIAKAEAALRQFSGKNDFPSYEVKLAFAREVQVWLEEHGLRVVCPFCDEPANLRCRSLGTPNGVFQFEHTSPAGQRYHQSSTAFPDGLRLLVAFPRITTG